MSVWIKCLRVILSCKTLPQLRVAEKYIENALIDGHLTAGEYLEFKQDLSNHLKRMYPGKGYAY